MMGNEYKTTAEQRAYSNGYAAGKRNKQRSLSMQQRAQKKNAFWQRAFLAALPAAFVSENWMRGDKPICTLEQRMRLAADIADEATKQALRNL